MAFIKGTARNIQTSESPIH